MGNRYARLGGFFLAVAMVVLAAQDPARPAKGDAAAGKQLFDRKCSVCHAAASDQRIIGPGLKGTSHGKLPGGKLAVHDVLLKLINQGGGGMPVFKDLLSDQEKEDLIAYLLTL